ncbi:UDP-glucose 4-epimerase [Sinomonas cellulolyticus]|uniref:UDP-glucose 4-epimerase n=1 Tax=Sinomonas cellulolyticus TaxID=2801916 RepID=A0ABS1K1A6_9MICC|nr:MULTISPECIES: UDP-glucose 4-epimerase GalE [Sinomonas]MBL0704682.1 UDP-glucose 4-epimerase GalE [Sinomonas cellulolyticus]GHG46407.1 UDP-glucose 4-epimerase [Sinomonas sp. KCTC 49339]
MRVLVTGGAGYLGTHTCLSLISAGHEVTVLDNFVNSSAEAVRRTSELARTAIPVIEGDLLDPRALMKAMDASQPDAVVHFAGLKAVGESNTEPLRYMTNNVTGTLQLLEAMEAADVRRIIFSSSATVYGVTETVPTREDHALSVTNPYGRTKLVIEDLLRDIAAADPRWSIGILRYFNPVGAHPSGMIGEDPTGTPNNLVPFVGQVAVGRHEAVSVFGGDYPTPDGTGIRDYLHVMDLAEGHVAALDWITAHTGVDVWNLGTGTGYSVLDVIRMYESVSGHPVPFRMAARRAGDVAVSYADANKAAAELGWRAGRSLREMIEDHWRWQSANPDGYER